MEKTLLKIPSTCIVESNGEMGVIKRTDQSDTFLPVSILDSDESFSYVPQDFETLKIGDVILEGTGENAATYTISEVATYQGVYVANSSIAEFKVVDVIGQNSQYSIVDATNQYGLKIYDKIVSDAKTVSEEEAVF